MDNEFIKQISTNRFKKVSKIQSRKNTNKIILAQCSNSSKNQKQKKVFESVIEKEDIKQIDIKTQVRTLRLTAYIREKHTREAQANLVDIPKFNNTDFSRKKILQPQEPGFDTKLLLCNGMTLSNLSSSQVL